MSTWTNSFTTLFNKAYLAKGLALCQSLERTCTEFRLFLFALDSETEMVVKQAAFPHVTVISLSQLEEYCQTLLTVKPNRNTAEYCWTCKGPSMQYCLDCFNLDSICYLDSDLYFFYSPKVLFEESMPSDVILTLHNFFNVEDLGESNGFHCAQLMAFKNNVNGRAALDWWTNLCLEWCYARHERGRFGDQKYLDSFADHWEGVHDIERSVCGGPWNIQRYRILKENGNIVVEEGGEIKPLVFYHFHFLRNKRYELFEELNFGPYKYSKSLRKIIYAPYIVELMKLERMARTIYPSIDALGSEQRQASMVRQIYHFLKFFPKENVVIWKRK